MANDRDVALLLEGVKAWNEQRGGPDNPSDLSGLDFFRLFQTAGKLGNDGEIPLAGYSFDCAKLVGAHLVGANLHNANFFAADLTDAWLSDANLVGARFFGADLTDADLTDANLVGARFWGADLTDADLTDASLVDASLWGANLTDANLTGANLGGANLGGANLTGANLTYANLTGANLTDANLTSANLTRANLTRANLTDANLPCANLTDANLTSANLTHANLTDANLTRANCTNAILYDAILENASCQMANFTDADLTGAKLWEAVIFDGADASPVQYQIEPKPIKSMEDLLVGIKEIKSCYQGSEEAVRLYFRGEAQSIYELQPSAMREKAFIENEGAMLTDLASRRPEEFNGLVSGLAQLVLAQHNGLKTRFLDISRNPLVALFHACGGGESSQEHSEHDGRMHVFVAPRQMVKPFNSDTVSVIANYARLPMRHQMALTGGPDKIGAYSTAMEQLVQLIQAEKPYFASRIDPRDFYRVIIVEPQQSPERIRAQSGAFLVSAFHEQFERDQVLHWNDKIPVYAHYPLTVSKKYKTRILDELRMFNITREALFPGLDTAAEAIMQSYHKRQS